MADLSKLTVQGSGPEVTVLWGGDQVAFAVDDAGITLCVALTDEDLENAEHDHETCVELRGVRVAIMAELRARGFTLEENAQSRSNPWAD